MRRRQHYCSDWWKARAIDRRLRGFTLVELMVALLIGLIILAALSQLFITSRSTYSLEEGMARVQEGSRFSFEFLTNDIRMAGYAGCGSFTSADLTGADAKVGNIANPPTLASTFNPDGVSGYYYTGTGSNLTDWSPALDGTIFVNGEVRAGNDVIFIQRASQTDAFLAGNTEPSNANIQIVNTAALAQTGQISAGDVLMVSDCKKADIFRATAVPQNASGGLKTIPHTNAMNTDNFLTHSFDNRAALMKLVSRAYYIGTNASGEPALFRKELGSGGGISAQELVEGVEQMRILYGEDTDGDGIANIYRTANNVAIWTNVVNVRVALLVRTTENVASELDTKTFNAIPGFSFNPANDNRRRQVFGFTVKLRNQ